MAKAAKSVDIEITPKLVNGIVRDVFEGIEGIESARGTYMQKARRQREIIQAVYERGAAQGIPQKVMKIQVEIERLGLKLKGKIAELESENRKMLQKAIKAHGDKAQMALFGTLPPMPKPEKAKGKKHPGVTGDDLTDAMAAAGNA